MGPIGPREWGELISSGTAHRAGYHTKEKEYRAMAGFANSKSSYPRRAMPETIMVGCPNCKKTIKAPATIKGKKIRCKGCGQAFTAEEFKEHEEEWGTVTGYGMTIDKDRLRCPYCAGELDDESQVLCLHCGYNLQTRERVQPKVLHPVGFSDYFMYWLPAIFGFFVFLFFAWSIVYTWVWWPDADWNPEFMKGNPIPYQVFSSLIDAFIMFKIAQWIVKNRVLKPHPPEIEKLQVSRGND